MRLSDLLSKPPKKSYTQVDGFLINKKYCAGRQVPIDIGTVGLNYFCAKCDNMRTFYSKGKVSSVFITPTMASIDCALSCNCGTTIPVWFLIDCKNDIASLAPEIRIIQRGERLAEGIAFRCDPRYGGFSELLDKAEQAYWTGLGAGSIVYLRKIFEKVTIQVADTFGIEYKKYDGGNPKNFSALLQEVDERYKIIPKEFSSDSYRLFRELSSVVHGEYDEVMGLEKYEPLRRLVVGILENVRNSQELKEAMLELGWKGEIDKNE